MKLPPIYIQDFSGGQANNINPNLVPDNCVDLSLNLDFDEELGSAVSRLGTAIVDSQLVDNKAILGIGQHVDQSDSTKNKLFAVVNDSSNTNADIFDLDGTPAISLADDTASLKCRFLNYNGDTVRLNGTDNPKAYDSTNWITTGGVFDLANMPTGYKYAKVFLSRVYLWGKASAPYTLVHSGILTSGAVSWTSGNGTVEIEPEDNGGAGTGLAKVPGYLLVFKQRALHRWNFDSAFPEELVNIGAPSQEAIVEGGGLVAFFSASNESARGFYVTNGGRPTCISHSTQSGKSIKKWVDAIPTANEPNVAGFATDNGFKWSVGDLTVDAEAYTNVWLCYNRQLDQWSVRSYPTEFKCFAPYVVSGLHTIVGGDDDGTVYRVDKAATYSDNGTSIKYKLRTRHEDFGSNTLKELTDRIVVRGKNLRSALVSVVPDEDPSAAVPQTIAPKSRSLVSIFNIERPIAGNTLSIEVSGETAGARASIREIELPGVDAQQSYV